jgi:hypothetical protein
MNNKSFNQIITMVENKHKFTGPTRLGMCIQVNSLVTTECTKFALRFETLNDNEINRKILFLVTERFLNQMQIITFKLDHEYKISEGVYQIINISREFNRLKNN